MRTTDAEYGGVPLDIWLILVGLVLVVVGVVAAFTDDIRFVGTALLGVVMVAAGVKLMKHWGP